MNITANSINPAQAQTMPAMKRNFILFAAAFRRAYQAPTRITFLSEQWTLLCAGVRDGRIHDTALVAWSEVGGSATA